VTLKEILSKDRSSLTLKSESEMLLKDMPMRQRPVKSCCLHLTFSSSSELEKSSLEKSKSLLLLLVIALVVGVIPVGVVVLVGGVELLSLGAVSDEVGGVAALEAAPR
jgi:hypothetical protein